MSIGDRLTAAFFGGVFLIAGVLMLTVVLGVEVRLVAEGLVIAAKWGLVVVLLFFAFLLFAMAVDR